MPPGTTSTAAATAAKRKRKTSNRVDTGIRKHLKQVDADIIVADDGADALLRLGCILFLERVAHEAHHTRKMNGKEHGAITREEMRKAIRDVLAESHI